MLGADVLTLHVVSPQTLKATTELILILLQNTISAKTEGVTVNCPVQVISSYHLVVADTKGQALSVPIPEVSSVVKSCNCLGIILLGLPRRKSVYIILKWLTIFSFDARGWQEWWEPQGGAWLEFGAELDCRVAGI